MENTQEKIEPVMAEFASNLLMEVLNVREGLRARLLTEEEALRRIRQVRRRRMSGDGGLLRQKFYGGEGQGMRQPG